VVGATILGGLASALAARAEEASIIAELKAGSEEAYAWLVAQYHQPIYSLVYRILNDPADAADTTQEIFLKVYRGMKHFNGASSLKTWMYRIAVHEASNQRRWWFRHRARETSLDPIPNEEPGDLPLPSLKDTLADEGATPYDNAAQRELQARVEAELRKVPEPYRTTVILRDLEEFSYEEIAEVTQTTLGTVKSRLMRGREALRKCLQPYIRQEAQHAEAVARCGREVEVTS
jgi:RNA polymerase sigma-70 factor (ECF subfamily)